MKLTSESEIVNLFLSEDKFQKIKKNEPKDIEA